MKNLSGSEKQIAWAEDIRGKALAIAKANNLNLVVEELETIEESREMIDRYKIMTSEYKNNTDKYLFLVRREDALKENAENAEEEIEVGEEVEVESNLTRARKAGIVQSKTNKRIGETLCFFKNINDKYIFTIPENFKGILEEELNAINK